MQVGEIYKSGFVYTIVIAVLYVLLGLLGQTMSIPPGNVTPIWPPSGFALAMVLLFGRKAWPGIFLGAFLVNTQAFFDAESINIIVKAFITGLLIAAGSLLQPIFGGLLLRKFCCTHSFLDSHNGFLRFCMIAPVMCVVSSSIGSTSLLLMGAVTYDAYATVWGTWWLGDTIGVIFFATLIMVMREAKEQSWHRYDVLIFYILLALVTMFSFGQFFSDESIRYPLAFLPIPVLLVFALRHGIHHTILANCVIAVISVVLTYQGRGPFVVGDINVSLIFLQVYVGMAMITSMTLAILIKQQKQTEKELLKENEARARTEQQLIELKDNLEDKVLLRTIELEKKTQLLTEQSQHICLLMDSTEEAIYGANLDGICTFVNPACVKMLGYSNQDELVGHSIHEMIHHTHADGSAYPKETCLVRLATLERQSGHSDEEVHWRKDGTNLPVEWWSHPIIQDDTIIGSVVTFIDITERKKAERDLLEAHNSLEKRVQERTEELEKASNAKTEFLSRMSHELRTPLNAISGFGQLLEIQLSGNEEHKQYINEVLHASEHLLELINETLDLSRIESGKMELNIEDVYLSKVLDECVALLQPLIDEHELTFTREDSGAGDYILRVDKMRAKQVVINILSNAIKYNCKEGTITLRVTAGDKGRARISIIDTGPGIDESMQERIFEPFDRLGSSESIEGTGVGLAITKSLVEIMGGNIGLTSEVGSGSTFWVEFKGVVKDSPEGTL